MKVDTGEEDGTDDGGAAVKGLGSVTLFGIWDKDLNLSFQKECRTGQDQNMWACFAAAATSWVHIVLKFYQI